MLLNMAHKQYKQDTIFTSSPEKLTLILYNELVKFVIQAKHSIEEKKMQKAHDCTVKAKKILINFENTLDMKIDPKYYRVSFLEKSFLSYRSITKINYR